MLDYGFYNMDCMDGMKQFPDKYFDLAIVDPPYGDGGQWKRQDKSRFGGVFDRYRKNGIPREDLLNGGGAVLESLRAEVRQVQVARTGGTWASKFGKKIISWDTAPKQDYFEELFRVSRNQIIWGGQLL